eukprot:7391944-Prymnesium_polylepis.1
MPLVPMHCTLPLLSPDVSMVMGRTPILQSSAVASRQQMCEPSLRTSSSWRLTQRDCIEMASTAPSATSKVRLVNLPWLRWYSTLPVAPSVAAWGKT